MNWNSGNPAVRNLTPLEPMQFHAEGATLPSILVVDDDPGVSRLMEKSLIREGYVSRSAASGQEAIRVLQEHSIDLILLDLKLPDIDGADLIRRIADLNHQIPFVVITGQGDERVAVEMMKRGALDYLVKDVRFQESVPAVVRRALTQADRDRKLAKAEADLHRAHALLEKRIEERTAELAKTNADLKNEIAERERAEKALRHAHSELEERVRERTAELATTNKALQADIAKRKRLETEILEISAREQRRIGQDLHDGLGQHLAGIELMSQVLEQRLSKLSKSAAAQAARISEHVRDAISQARLLAQGLSPVVLESQGLMCALQELAARTEKLFQVACVFQCPSPVLIDDNGVATHLFRIAQEAVTNAAKHGKATRIEVQLDDAGDGAQLSIKDNGCGLSTDAEHSTGMGLRIMQYRASMISASLSVKNEPPAGVRVACRVRKARRRRKSKTANVS